MKRMLRQTLLSLLLLSSTIAPLWAAGDSETKAEDPAMRQAVAEVKAERYAEAVPLLQKIIASDARNADAHNWLGYSLRKQGQPELAVEAYKRALAIDSSHRGAHEYLGEAYLEMGDPAKAEEHLARLDSICFFGCEEFTDLKEAIAAYKAKR